MKRERKKEFIGAQVRTGVLDTQFSQRRELRAGTFGQAYIWFFHEELQSILTKDVPESYRLYLTFLLCSNMFNYYLMGTREVFWFFLTFVFGMLLFWFFFK